MRCLRVAFWVIVLWILVLWVIASAQPADAASGEGVLVTEAFYKGPEIGTQPGFYESYDEAVAYWAIPGIKSLTDACGPPPQMFSVVNDPSNSSGYAVTVKGEKPCRIWAEEEFIEFTDTLPDWQRDQARCELVVHEIGHTLGLAHKDYGDPSRVMTKSVTTPALCEASYPAPSATSGAEAAPTLCVPAWAFYGPQKALREYLVGRERQAYRTFKRWARKDRSRASYESRAAVCQTTTYWFGAPAGK